jgi:hypothetical protein
MGTNASLWPKVSGGENRDLPITILKEQAAYLGQSYPGRLEANVWARPLGTEMRLTLVIVVPDLDDYEYRLLEVRNGLDGYPATVSFFDSTFEVRDSGELVQCLRQVLLDQRTQLVITQLLDAVTPASAHE